MNASCDEGRRFGAGIYWSPCTYRRSGPGSSRTSRPTFLDEHVAAIAAARNASNHGSPVSPSCCKPEITSHSHHTWSFRHASFCNAKQGVWSQDLHAYHRVLPHVQCFQTEGEWSTGRGPSIQHCVQHVSCCITSCTDTRVKLSL